MAGASLVQNAMLSTRAGTLYVLLYGRVPCLLPQIEDLVEGARQEDEIDSESTRHVHLLREISVACAMAAMAARRLKLVKKLRTPGAGAPLTMRVKDQVETKLSSNLMQRWAPLRKCRHLLPPGRQREARLGWTSCRHRPHRVTTWQGDSSMAKATSHSTS